MITNLVKEHNKDLGKPPVSEEQNKEREYRGILAEYESLRTEIMKRQEARLSILAFTLAVVGTILGISFQGSSPFVLNSYLPVALGIFALIVIIAALALTVQYTQQNKAMTGYIRKYIEPEIPLMAYETRWKKYRILKGKTSFIFPLTTSRALSITYILLTSAVCLVITFPAFGLDSFNCTLALSTIFVFSFSAYGLALDLFLKKTKGWEIDWDILGREK